MDLFNCEYFVNRYSFFFFFLFPERILRSEDKPLEILQEWGPQQDEVKFVLRYTVLSKPDNLGKFFSKNFNDFTRERGRGRRRRKKNVAPVFLPFEKHL